MFKTIKKILPLLVFILLTAGAVGLWLDFSDFSILAGGLGAATSISLLIFAVIRWDDAYLSKVKEKRQLARIVDKAKDAIVVYDATGLLLYANRRAQESYGMPATIDSDTALEIPGLESARRYEIFQQVLSGEPWNGEVQFNDPEKNDRIHLINMFLLSEFQGQVPAIVSIGRDISKRKELEQTLLHSQKLAAVGELAAGVAHEINNPMAAILSQIGLARDILEMPPDKTDEQQIMACIDEASKQVKRCSQIVESLLHFSRRYEPQRSELAIGQAVSQAVEFIQSLPKMKQLSIETCNLDELPTIQSDLNSISQIVINLLTNAADATDYQGHIRISGHSDQDEIALIISDDGSGIDGRVMERVFEPFFTTKPPGKGTGLGLSLSYNLSQSLGGELRLHSPDSGGTTATLTLPVE